MSILTSDGTDRHEEYINAKPFPHIDFVDLFETEALCKVLREFPKMETEMTSWKRSYHTNDKFFYHWKEHNIIEAVQPHTRELLEFLSDTEFLTFLSNLTGIQDLKADPHFAGAGPCSVGPGGHLNMHVDFNAHPSIPKWHRRINVLIYLCEYYEESWGGHLELWPHKNAHQQDQDQIVKIPPAFNHTGIFNTSDHSWHGHPYPFACPPDERRRFISAYYFTERDYEMEERHGTDFLPKLF